jgi:rRNA small subunit pseudouridine methyltransferase Nep1
MPQRLIVVLENATLETVKLGSGKTKRKGESAGTASFHLLNCDDHAGLLKKNGRDPAEMRPDIAHQVFQILYIFSF